VRPQYLLKKSADWGSLAAVTSQLTYPVGSTFSQEEFDKLRSQLAAEMRYVAALKNIVSQTRQIERLVGHDSLASESQKQAGEILGVSRVPTDLTR
jgi:hypothetical protein